MLHVADLQSRSPGYVRGGCSPVGMKKAVPSRACDATAALCGRERWSSGGRQDWLSGGARARANLIRAGAGGDGGPHHAADGAGSAL